MKDDGVTVESVRAEIQEAVAVAFAKWRRACCPWLEGRALSLVRKAYRHGFFAGMGQVLDEVLDDAEA